MSIDPQLIRSEEHREIGELIRRDAGVIIGRWSQRAVAEQPCARRVHHEALQDDLPGLLEALGRTLSESDPAETAQHRRVAADHGGQRWEAGWSLPEVVRDYQILRLVVVEYLEENLERPLTSHEVMAIGLALDEAISASVAMYATNREDHILRVEHERTEQERRAREALQEADRRKDEFLAVVAHELRNPLAPLLNSVQVLNLLGSRDPTLHQVREIIDRQTRQMARLVDDLLDLSRVARGQLQLHKERVELGAAVRQAVQTSEPLVRARQHQLSVNLTDGSLWLEADPSRLVQVLVNLLNNAAKYTDPGGRIDLTAGREDVLAVVRVRDTGVGIPPEVLPRIFDLFMQVEGSRHRSQGGLGIGLALVRRLVELQGGTVEAHSAGPGQGSEFVVRLPLAGEAQAGAASGVKAGGAPAGRHILIVEDHADARETLATLLGLLGHRVEVAGEGPAGVERALAGRPEVALIDLALPGLDGYQVAQRVRAALGEKVFLVALTGFGQPEDRQRVRAAGFDAHVLKPVELKDLSALLDTLPARQPPPTP